MKRVDVIIIGAGRAGRSIAAKLATQKKEVLLVAHPKHQEDYFRGLINTLAGVASPPPTSSPHEIIEAKTIPRFLNSRTLHLNEEEIQAKHFVIATGCGPRIPEEFQNRPIQLPLDVLSLSTPPQSATIIGAGPIGVATAALLAQRGCAVTLVTRRDRILLREEPEIAAAIQSWLTSSLAVRLQLQASTIPTDNIILATGLRPHTYGMDLPKAGVYVNSEERIVVDEEMRTPTPHIHAAGAVTGPVLNLAYEDFQAAAIAENIPAPFFNRQKLQPEPFPFIFPMNPIFARIGLTEKEAREEKRGILSVNCPLGTGHIKLVGREKTAELLGAHIFAPGSDGLILYFDLLIRAGISMRDVTEKHHFASPGVAPIAGEAIQAWLQAAGEGAQ